MTMQRMGFPFTMEAIEAEGVTGMSSSALTCLTI